MRAAVDFTVVNGKFGEDGSLHNPGDSNRYEQVLHAIGSVLDPYSIADKLTFFGFGAVKNDQGDSYDVTARMGDPYDETARMGNPYDEAPDDQGNSATFVVTVDKTENPKSSGVDSLIA